MVNNRYGLNIRVYKTWPNLDEKLRSCGWGKLKRLSKRVGDEKHHATPSHKLRMGTTTNPYLNGVVTSS